MVLDPNATEVGSNGSDTLLDPSFLAEDDGNLKLWVSRFWPQWSIEKYLGRGSFGQVYKISKQELGFVTSSAAKVFIITEEDTNIGGLSGSQPSLQASVKAAYGEIESMKELSGEPNIVIINESRCEPYADGRAYVIGIRMELLQGLDQRWQQFGSRFSDEEAMRVARDICRALIACHKHNIWHRDVKPKNVFWCERTGAYKLGDLGAAKQMGLRTQSATFIGTLDYMAPEVMAYKPYSHTADIYSLGIMLFYLLNYGVKPFLPLGKEFDAKLDESATQKRLAGEAFPNPVCGDDYIGDLIRSATAGNPKHRFKSAQAFYNAICAWPGWDRV